jgi:hypothetical protein
MTDEVSRLIEIARDANRADSMPNDDLWVARRLAAMVLYLAPKVSYGLVYSNIDWSRFKPPAAEKTDNESIFDLPKKGEH